MSRHEKSRKKRHFWRNFILWLLLACTAIFISCDLYLEFHGAPEFLRTRILAKMSTEYTTFSAKWIKLGIFHGITVEQLKIASHAETGTFSMNADELRMKPRLSTLLSDTPEFDSIILLNGKAVCFLPDNIQAVVLENIHLQGHITGDGRLNAALDFDANGISFACSANVQNGAKLRELFYSNMSEGNTGKFQQYMTTWEKLQRQIHFGYGDSYVDLQLECDALANDKFHVAGTFGFSQALVYGCLINKQSGKFILTPEGISIYDFQMLLNPMENLEGSLDFDFTHDRLSCDISGSLIPANTMRRLQQSPRQARFNRILDMTQPVSFTMNGTSDIFFQSPSLTLQANFNRLDISDIVLYNGSLDASYADNSISVNHLQAFLSPYDTEPVTAKFNWNTSTNLAEGSLQATFNLYHRLQELKLIQYSNALLNDFKDTTLKLTLYPSPLELSKLHVACQLTQNSCHLMKAKLDNLTLKATLQNEILTIDELSADLARTSRNAFLDTAFSVELAPLLQHRPVSIPFMATLKNNDAPVTTLSGTFNLDLQKKICSADNCHSTIFFQESYRTIIEELNLPAHDIPDAIHTHGAPAQIDFRLHPVPWTSLTRDWTVSGTAAAENGEFNTLLFKNLDGKFRIDRQNLVFQDIRSTLEDGGHFTINEIDYAYLQKQVTLTGIDYYGNPGCLGSFILDNDVEDFYKELWRDVSWAPDALPHLYTPMLRYTDTPVSYSLVSSLAFNARNTAYQKLAIDSMTGSLELALPERVDLNQTDILTSLGDFRLDVTLLFGGSNKCIFQLANGNTKQLNPAELLKAAGARWITLEDHFDIRGNTDFNCRGEFSFRDSINDFLVTGNLKTEHVAWDTLLEFNQINAEYIFSQNGIGIAIHNADLLDGNLKGTLFYNNTTKQGEAIVNARNMALDKCHDRLLVITRRLQDKSNSASQDDASGSGDAPVRSETAESDGELSAAAAKLLKGIINADCHLSFYKDWGAIPWNFEGSGRLAIRDADLWRVPLMSTLGSMLSWSSFNFFKKDAIASLGLISELDADFELRNDRIIVPSVTTNGTFIALNGSGEYSLDTNQIHFIVKRDLMKDINLVSFLLKPLNWAFDAELTGPATKPEWHIRTAIQKIFSH